MKKILIGIPNLQSGGVEVSLIRFINILSQNKDIKITLLMLEKEGMYLKSVPKNVKIIELKYIDDIYRYNRQIRDVCEIKGMKRKIQFVIYRLKLRKYMKMEQWYKYYQLINSKTVGIDDNFDIAIDWHGYGHFITSVISKIPAKKHLMWIHDEKNEWIVKIKDYLDNYDRIFCVGKSCLNNILKHNPELSDKLDVFYNMTDYENIRTKAKASLEENFNKKQLNIITVGRLEYQKAYDIAVLIAKILKDRKIDFCWRVIGNGSKKDEIEKLIEENELRDNFKLLGIKSNPFPYVKNSDLYVLCSRHEGYCLATLEAKILGKVIVATDIDSNREQIKNNYNGILCELDPEAFADKIINISSDKSKKKKIETNLAKEDFNNIGEFDKLYKLMEE